MIRIGYQGIEGSNSHTAAKKMVANLNFENLELQGLITSKDVISSLINNKIDYGVVATKNSTTGIVKETYDAIKSVNLSQVTTDIIPITHSAFSVKKIDHTSVKLIISHEQALRQCSTNIKKFFPNAKLEPIKDTAIGAKYLATQNKYDKDSTVVLCTEHAAKKYNLTLIEKDLQDDMRNRTEFRMFRIRDEQFKKNIFHQIGCFIYSGSSINWFVKALMVLAILASLIIKDLLDWNHLKAAISIGSTLSTIFLFITSKKLKDFIYTRSVIGYWEYYAVPSKDKFLDAQKYDIPRVVKISERNSKLHFEGWLCGHTDTTFFKTSSTLTTPLDQKEGQIVYRYNNQDIPTPTEFDLTGIVALSWKIDSNKMLINTLDGSYTGKSASDMGFLRYRRISKQEFNSLLKSEYL